MAVLGASRRFLPRYSYRPPKEASDRWCAACGRRGIRRSGSQSTRCCLFPATDRFHSEECGRPFLPEAKMALDLAFGVRIHANQMAYATYSGCVRS